MQSRLKSIYFTLSYVASTLFLWSKPPNLTKLPIPKNSCKQNLRLGGFRRKRWNSAPHSANSPLPQLLPHGQIRPSWDHFSGASNGVCDGLKTVKKRCSLNYMCFVKNILTFQQGETHGDSMSQVAPEIKFGVPRFDLRTKRWRKNEFPCRHTEGRPRLSQA